MVQVMDVDTKNIVQIDRGIMVLRILTVIDLIMVLHQDQDTDTDQNQGTDTDQDQGTDMGPLCVIQDLGMDMGPLLVMVMVMVTNMDIKDICQNRLFPSQYQRRRHFFRN